MSGGGSPLPRQPVGRPHRAARRKRHLQVVYGLQKGLRPLLHAMHPCLRRRGESAIRNRTCLPDPAPGHAGNTGQEVQDVHRLGEGSAAPGRCLTQSCRHLSLCAACAERAGASAPALPGLSRWPQAASSGVRARTAVEEARSDLAAWLSRWQARSSPTGSKRPSRRPSRSIACLVSGTNMLESTRRSNGAPTSCGYFPTARAVCAWCGRWRSRRIGWRPRPGCTTNRSSAPMSAPRHNSLPARGLQSDVPSRPRTWPCHRSEVQDACPCRLGVLRFA